MEKTQKFENGIRNLKKVVEILVFGTLCDVIITGLGKIDSFAYLLDE